MQPPTARLVALARGLEEGPSHAAIAVVLRTVLVLHGVGLPAGNPFAWHGHDLLFVLHVGYAWLALGYAIRAGALLGPAWQGPWALHGLLVGAIGTMTLAVMARATLGHTGRPLHAGAVLTLAFLSLQAAAISRLLGPWAGPDAWRLAGALWIAAFGLFLLRCGPMFWQVRRDQ